MGGIDGGVCGLIICAYYRRILQSVLTRWRSKPKNHPAYEDEEHSLQGKTGKVKTSSNFFSHISFSSL